MNRNIRNKVMNEIENNRYVLKHTNRHFMREDDIVLESNYLSFVSIDELIMIVKQYDIMFYISSYKNILRVIIH